MRDEGLTFFTPWVVWKALLHRKARELFSIWFMLTDGGRVRDAQSFVYTRSLKIRGLNWLPPLKVRYLLIESVDGRVYYEENSAEAGRIISELRVGWEYRNLMQRVQTKERI